MRPDIVIVGAGVIGAATAFHLSQLNAGSVLVVDRQTVGAGMSSRSSALVRMHYTFGPEVDLAVRSLAMFAAWSDVTGRPPVLRRTGFVRIVRPGEEDLLRANVTMQRAYGATAEVISAAALGELAPGMRTDDVAWAAWEPDGGYGDGAVVAGDLLASARERGVRYWPHCPVRALLSSGDRITGIDTGRGAVRAGMVVLAAGVWSAELLLTAGIKLPVETEVHKVAVLAHQPGRGAPVACIDSTSGTYFRPESGGSRTLVGGFAGPRGTDPDAIPAVAPPEALAGLVESASHRVPSLADAGIAAGVAGVYDMSPDNRPLLGAIPGVPGLLVATGFSGMGFKIAPAVGQGIAELVAYGQAREVDLGAFRPSRFSEGKPIVPPFAYAEDE